MPIDFRIPIAIGKSSKVPVFFMVAGDKFIIYFLLNNSIPQFFIAVFTLSFASLIFVSGNPTISQQGIPPDTSTSTLIKNPSKPCKTILFITDNKKILLSFRI